MGLFECSWFHINDDVEGGIGMFLNNDDSPLDNCTVKNTWDGIIPTVYLGFDGVINVIPSDENESSSTGIPSRGSFNVDSKGRIYVKEESRHYRFNWSSELTDNLKELQDNGQMQVAWLTTWTSYTKHLDRFLGWDHSLTLTQDWDDESSRNGIWDGKINTITSRIAHEARMDKPTPIVWIDDEECDDLSVNRIVNSLPAEPDLRIMIVQPDSRIGISRPQLDHVKAFLNDPGSFNTLTFDRTPGPGY